MAWRSKGEPSSHVPTFHSSGMGKLTVPLKIVQKQRGWVPDGAIYAIADVLGIPASDVEGVATFYSQIFR
ncbi:NAD(P)H-dependent oxidoreductase subunit E, partial [Salmonella enterica subsp. enterica serovar Kentucky]|nr:NAD(P)H-dependent oxidoreductase subunit E [Salmonella enterica subsp. enterica serovar Kentucky]